MKKKPPIKKHMLEAKKALKDIMKQNLQAIADTMVHQIMARARKSTPSDMLDAIKNVDKPGVQAYKSILKSALAVISYDALNQVRKEVPKARKVKLSEPVIDTDHPIGVTEQGEVIFRLDEFDNLPPKIQDKVTQESSLIVESQVGDVEKEVYFQFLSSYDSTDSMDTLESDLQTVADDYVEGSAIDSGSQLVASEMINEARDYFFSDPEVSKQVDALQFVNGDPVTTICTQLDGVIFSQDDPLADRFTPPFHWNCKTYVIPILDLGDDEVESLTDYADLESEIQFSESKSKVIRLIEQMNHGDHCPNLGPLVIKEIS